MYCYGDEPQPLFCSSREEGDVMTEGVDKIIQFSSDTLWGKLQELEQRIGALERNVSHLLTFTPVPIEGLCFDRLDSVAARAHLEAILQELDAKTGCNSEGDRTEYDIVNESKIQEHVHRLMKILLLAE